jgi:general secretion pathway protein K
MRARRGIALITALALLVLISGAAVELTAAAKPRRLSVAAILDRAELDAAATGGIEHARAQLAQLMRVGALQSLREPTRVLDAWSAADGMVVGASLGNDVDYRVQLRDAGARLNLNAAGEDELRQLFVALHIDARRADRLAEAIADWRDGDQLRRANGAERNDYVRDGRAVLPDDGPFASVAMLRFVIGMTDSLYRLVLPYVSTLGSGRVNLNAAPRPVLIGLPGMTEETVAALLRYRQQGRRVADLNRFADELSPSARLRLRAAMQQLQAMTVLDPRAIHVASEAWRRGTTTRARIDAIVSRDDEGRVVWRRVSP